MEIEENDPAEENLILSPVSGKRMLLMHARLGASLEKSKACEKENVYLRAELARGELLLLDSNEQ